MNLYDRSQIDTLLHLLAQFHFIRPYNLLIIVPALLMAALLFRRERNHSAWQQHFDPILLAPLLQGKINHSGKKRPTIILLFWITCALALAGPAWEKLPTPVEKRDTALIILLDLSPSMLARDVNPSRLIMARHKILDLLRLRKEGYSALIAYSGDAHVVSPLTDDTQTIANLLNALEPGIMPVYGSNLEHAVQNALALFKNAGYTQGDLLLVTDGITTQTISNTVPLLSASEFTLSIIGVGTEEGAPIPDNAGGFLKDSKGGIILPQLEEEKLRALARQVDGYYSPLQLDDRDIQPLIEGRLAFNQHKNSQLKNGEIKRNFDQWRDTGGILALLLLPLLLIAFRRGVIISLMLALPLLQSTKVEAETTSQAEKHSSTWERLWLNDNQRGMKAMKNNDYGKAAKDFSDPDWKAAAQYEAGDYAAALKHFQSDLSANGYYNQANALAKSGQLEQAIAAYKEALKKNPQFEHAAFNKKVVEDLLKQQKQEPQKKQGDKDQGDNSGDQSQSQGENNHQEDNTSTPDQPDADQEGQTKPNLDEQQKAHEEKDKNKSDTDAQMEKSDSGENQTEESSESQLTPEQKQMLEQWLRQIPDDPSGLLRNKFEYYYQQRLQEEQSGKKDQHLNDEQRW